MISKLPAKHPAQWLALSLSTLLLTACDFEVDVTGNGRVVSNPVGIDCREASGTCLIENYEKLRSENNDAVVVSLTAYPDEGFRLAGWEGCDVSYRHYCFKMLNNNIQIATHFEPIQMAQDPAPQQTLRFVALGDFGEGNRAQELVGNAMAEACAEAGGCQFAIGLGDNIYDENPQHVYEDAFERKFEFPYRNVDFPFYMSLGNHDNSLLFDGLGSFNHSGDIQVAYTYREDKLSQKWQMPERYYQHAHPKEAEKPLAEFFALDSNPLISALEINPVYKVNLYKKKQGDWVDQALARSKASWKISYTHHPYISNGQHGNAGYYDGVPALETLSSRISGETYRKWFKQHVCGKVDVFFAGHDHDLQILKSVPDCGNTLFVISGAGAKSRSIQDDDRNQVWFQQGNQTGFILAEITGNRLSLDVYFVDPDSGEYWVAYEKGFQRRDLMQQ